MDIADLIKTGISIISVIFAFWQIKARLNIQKMLQQESFHLHSSVALILGNCQTAISNIKSNQIPDSLVSAGQAEGGSQMLLKQTAKIVCHYHNPTDTDIDAWILRGKINEHYKSLFLAYSQQNRGWLCSIYYKIKEKIF
ncbi:MAG: hypothetical protein Q7O04_01940 [Candidatus Omnitrophota bacterium]|nr:hypothetical protein [Candidatus Omnitrophota bacterium]